MAMDETDRNDEHVPVNPIVRRRDDLSVLAEQDAYGLEAAAPPAGTTKSFSLRDMLRFRGTIIITALAVAVPLVLLIWMTIKPRFTSSGIVRVSPIVQKVLSSKGSDATIPFYRSFLNTQVGLIRSHTVLQRVVLRDDVKATDWYGGIEMGKHLNAMAQALHVKTLGDTELIRVSFTSISADDARVIVDAVLNEYIRYVLNATDETSTALYLARQDEYSRRKADVEGLQQLIGGLRKDLGTGDPAELLNRQRVRLDTAQAEYESLARQLEIARWQESDLLSRLKTIEAPSDDEADPDQPEADLRYKGDPRWQELSFALRTARHRLALESRDFGQNHPAIVRLRNEVQFAEQQLRDYEKGLDNMYLLNPTTPATTGAVTASIGSELEATRGRIKLLEYQTGLLERDLRKLREQWERTFNSAQVLDKALADLAQKKQYLEDIHNQIERESIERNQPGTIYIQSRAVSPTSPDGDKRVMFTVAAMILGLSSGAGLAFVRAAANPSIHAMDDLVDHARTPFLGQLPRLHLKAGEDPLQNPMLAEGVRMVRTPLLQWIQQGEGNVVLITSPCKGDGKTTLTVLLARSLARCGQRVLLVDCDIRQPQVSAKLGLQPGLPGLQDALAQRADGDACIVATDIPNLSVLPAGRPTDDTVDPEQLTNGAFTSALDHWRRSYDVVLLDSAPVLPVADARILTRHADGTVLLVRGGQTHRSDAFQALRDLANAGGALWGTVFLGSMRRNQYGYAGDYGYGTGR